MQSRSFICHAQRLNDTNIPERNKTLHISSSAWKNIKSHLDKKRLAEEALALERAKKKAMKEECQAMVDQWSNTAMNSFCRNEKDRSKTVESKQKEKYFEMRKEQEKIREKYVAEMKRTAYRKTGFPREIDTAFGAAEVIYERQKQIEVKRMFEQSLKEVDAEFAKQVLQGALDDKKENEEKARKLREKNREFARICLKAVKEQREREEQEKKARFEAELIDNINAAKEIKDSEKVRKQESQEYKNVVEKRLQKHRHIVNEQKRIDEQEDIDKDEIIAIQAAAKERMDCLVKRKSKELQDNYVARTVIVSGLVDGIEKEKLEREKQLLNIAEKEKLEEYDRKEQEKINHAQKLREERIAEHARIAQRAEKKQAEEIEVKKWELANRHKNTEYTKEHDQKSAAEKWKNVLAYRKILQEQILAENYELNDEALIKQEKEQIEAEDRQFFEYAEQIRDVIKSRGGRTTIPLEKVIERYKKINNLPSGTKRPCGNVSTKTSGNVAYDRDSDPNYMKSNWKVLYE